MESRLYELKALKKQWKQRRSKKTLIWRVFGSILFVLLVLVCVVYAMGRLPKNPITPYWEQLLRFLPFDLTALADAYALAAVLGLALLLLCCIIAGCCAGAKTKKSREYLSYRTLKYTLKAEKKER